MRVGREVRLGTLHRVQMSTLWQGSRGVERRPSRTNHHHHTA